MRIPKGSAGELVTEMLGTVKMNLLLNFNSTEYYQPGDTLPGKTNAGLMGAAEEKASSSNRADAAQNGFYPTFIK